jgi:hypothetical protein
VNGENAVDILTDTICTQNSGTPNLKIPLMWVDHRFHTLRLLHTLDACLAAAAHSGGLIVEGCVCELHATAPATVYPPDGVSHVIVVRYPICVQRISMRILDL